MNPLAKGVQNLFYGNMKGTKFRMNPLTKGVQNPFYGNLKGTKFRMNSLTKGVNIHYFMETWKAHNLVFINKGS
jgi:hypothetical protein